MVLVSFMAQPRLLYAMAKDGLLPRAFAEVDSRGTLFKGSLVRVQDVACLIVPAFRGLVLGAVAYSVCRVMCGTLYSRELVL